MSPLAFISDIFEPAARLIELKDQYATEFFRLVQIGLGGYVIGRSAEKVFASRRATAVKSDEAVR